MSQGGTIDVEVPRGEVKRRRFLPRSVQFNAFVGHLYSTPSESDAGGSR